MIENYIRKNILWILLVFSTLGYVQQSQAQGVPAVSVGSSLANGSLIVCDGDSSLTTTINLEFYQATVSTLITVDMPDGIEYAGDLQLVSHLGAGTASVTVHDDSDLTKPVFKVSLLSGSFAAGDKVYFSFSKKATGPALQNAKTAGYQFKDEIKAEVGGVQQSTATTATYNVNYPTMLVPPGLEPQNLNNVQVFSTVTRTFSLKGTSITIPLKEVYVIIDYGRPVVPAQNTVLKVNGTVLSPIGISGNEIRYTVKGADLGADQQFWKDEILNFEESTVVYSCGANSITNFKIGWGCGSNEADWAEKLEYTSQLNVEAGAPKFATKDAVRNNYTDACSTYSYTAFYTNEGTGGKTGAMYNTKLFFFHNSYNFQVDHSELANNPQEISNVRIGNQTFAIPHNYKLNLALNNLPQLLNDPDGPGVGLEDVDGDGYYDDIPVGNTISMTFDVDFNPSVVTCSNRITAVGYAMAVEYVTACDLNTVVQEVDRTYRTKLEDGFVLRRLDFRNNSLIEANVLSNVPFDMVISQSSYDNRNSYRTTDSRYQYVVTLPAGVTIDPTKVKWKRDTYNPSLTTGTVYSPTVEYTAGGSTFTVTSPDVAYGYFYIEDGVTFSCSGATANVENLEFTYNLIDVVAPTCPSKNMLVFCGIANTNVVDCPVCDTATGPGPSIKRVTVARADNSLGWTDDTMTAIVSRTSVSDYDLSKAYKYDEIVVSSTAVQQGPATDLGVKFVYNKPLSGSDPGLIPLKTVVTIEKAAGGTTSYTIMPTATTFQRSSATTVTETLDWDLTAGLTSNTISLASNDKITIETHYQVGSDKYSRNQDINIGVSLNIYNTKTGTPKQSPIWNGQEQYCNTFIPRFYLIGSRAVIVSDSFRGYKSCEKQSTFRRSILIRVNEPKGLQYATEYRPIIDVKSISIRVPQEIDIEEQAGYEVIDNGTGSGTGGVTTVTLRLDNTYSDPIYRQYIVDNIPASLSHLSSKHKTKLDAARLYVKTKPNCLASSPTLNKLRFSMEYEDAYYYFAKLPSQGSIESHASYALQTLFASPDLQIQDRTGVLNMGTQSSATWTVRLTNGGTVTATNLWFDLEASTGLTIVSVKDAATGQLVTPTLVGGSMYHLSQQGLASAEYKDYIVEFSSQSCDIATVNVHSGWDCDDFPATVGDACDSKELTLRANYDKAEISFVQIQDTGGTAQDLCNETSYKYAIRSIRTGNVYSPTIYISQETGLDIVGNQVVVEYPAGSNNSETITLGAAQGGFYAVDVSQHSGVVGYLTGVTATSTSSDVQVNIAFKAKTTCAFTSGVPMTVKISGKDVCGNVVDGSNQPVNTNPILLNGAALPYDIQITDLDFLGGGFVSNTCSQAKKLEVSYKIVAGNPSYQVGDKAVMSITIPKGFKYVANTYDPIANAEGTASLTVSSTAQGEDLLLLPVKQGLQNNDVVDMTFDIKEDPNALPECNTYTLKSRFVDRKVVNSAACAVSCGSGVLVTTGERNLSFELKKAIVAFSVQSTTATYDVANAAEDITVHYTISNTGDVSLPSGTPVSLFLDSDNDGVYSSTVDTLVASSTTTVELAGQSSQTQTFTGQDISPDAMCKLKLTILPQDGCYCSVTPAEVTVENLEGLAVTDTSICGKKKMVLGIANNPKYTYAWSGGPSSYLSATNVSNPTFTAPESQVTTTFIYKVTVTRAGGCTASDVVAITVYPLPQATIVYNSPYCKVGTATPATNLTGVSSGSYTSTTSGLVLNATTGVIDLAASTAGTYTVVYEFSSGASCTNTVEVPITINPIPTVNAVSSQEVCNGVATQIQFSGTVSGTTYSWTTTGGSIGLTASGSGDINFTPSNTGSTPVSATVTVTPNANGCTGAATSFTITVNPTPTVTAVSDATYCNGDTIPATTFGGSSVAGTTYHWETTIGGSTQTGVGSIPSLPATNTGSAPISATVTVTPKANGCSGALMSFTITVNPTPTVNSVSDATYCNTESGTAITFNGAVTSTTYNWTSSSNVGFGTSGSGNIAAFTANNTGSTPVSTTVTVTPSANGCTGAATSFTITVNPTPTVNSVSDATYCNTESGTAITFNGAVTGTTYNWTSSSNVGFGTSGSGNIAAFTANNTGTAPVSTTVTVTPSANGCTGAATSFTITVNPTPTVNSVSDTTYCNTESGAAISFTGAVTGTVYNWTSSTDVGFGTTGTGDVAVFTATNTGTAPVSTTVTVTPSANGCTGAATSFTITVNPTPTVNAVSDTTYCNTESGAAISFTGAVTGTVYSWTSSTDVGFGTTGTGDVAVFTATNTGNAPVSATVTVTPSANGCTGAATSFTITVNPTPTANAVSDVTYCAEDSASAISFTGAVTGTVYSWTSSTDVGFGTTGTGDIAVFTATNTSLVPISTTVTVTPSANGCTGAATSFTITVNPLPVVDTVTPVRAEICSYEKAEFTIEGTPGAIVTYHFNMAASQQVTLTGGQASVSVQASDVAGNGKPVVLYTESILNPTTGCVQSVTLSSTVIVGKRLILSGPDSTCVGNVIEVLGSEMPASVDPYISSDSRIATIFSNGSLTAVSEGQVLITFTNHKGCVVTKTITIYEGVEEATLSVTQPSCDGTTKVDGVVAITNYSSTLSYEILKSGATTSDVTVSSNGTLSGVVENINYSVVVLDGSCRSTESTFILSTSGLDCGSNTPTCTVPSAAAVSVVQPVCDNGVKQLGSVQISNYDASLTYTFTKAGVLTTDVSIESNGFVTGVATNVSYAVEVKDGDCAAPATVFTLVDDGSTCGTTTPTCTDPAAATLSVVQPVCDNGVKKLGSVQISNYNASLTYVFTKAGASTTELSIGSNGFVTGVATNVSYTVVVKDGDCAASATVFKLVDDGSSCVVPCTLDAPEVKVTLNCDTKAVTGQITNYDSSVTYSINPSASIDINGRITGLTSGSNYVLTSVLGDCTEQLSFTATDADADCPVVVGAPVIKEGFSPNGDGVNDVFKIAGLAEKHPKFTMHIYNRWGSLIYEYTHSGSGEPKWWDGKSTADMNVSGDKKLPTGTYYYIIKSNDSSSKTYDGWVYLNY